jgi:hypothetical protein
MPSKTQKAFFMLAKLRKDLFRSRQIYQVATDLKASELRSYYFVMTERQMLSGHSQKYHFDNEGIPIIPSYIDVEDQKMVYYPISIGQYGLAIWQTSLETGDENDKIRFLKIANWFIDNRIDDDKLGSFWLTEVDKPAYRIQAPWKSSFAQARAINILLRAFQLTNRAEYREVAERALTPLQYSVKEGGVTSFLSEGWFYEEYPSLQTPVLVLNGMIFSLFGIYDYMRVFPENSLASQLFRQGTETLLNILPRYDMGFWSKYSLCEADFHPAVDPSTIGYHHLHILQLEVMHQLTGQSLFLEYAKKWKKDANWWNIIKMYKIKYRALKTMNRL